jgi:hypothetical protein
MALLQASSVHIDQPLTNLTIAYLQNTTGFVADKVFPRLPVKAKSNRFYIYDRANFNRAETKLRAPNTLAPEVSFSLSQDSYTCDVFSLAGHLTNEVLANADDVLSIRQGMVELLTTKMLVDKEIRWASSFFVATPWGTQWTGVSGAPAASQVRQWNDYTNSTPIQDITNLQRTVMLKNGGFKPNVMVMGKEVRDQLIHNPNILNRLNGGALPTNTALITDAKLAEIFQVEELLIMESIQNTAAEGLTESNAFIGGKSVLMVYRPKTVGLMSAQAGVTFSWDELENASGFGINVKSFTGDFLAERMVAEKLEINMAYAHKVTGTDLGAFISTVVA